MRYGYRRERMGIETCTFRVAGFVLAALSIGMLPCLLIDFFSGNDITPFLIPLIISTVLSFILLIATKLPEIIRPIDGILMIGVMWLVSILFGSIPFILGGMSFIDGIFESASGITTTGSTIMNNIESWPKSILLWRSMMQWIGGIAIIMIFMFIMPSIGIGGREFIGNETSGSGSGNLSVKLRDAALQFSTIYVILTSVMVVLLLCFGVGVFDSFCMSFSTISTGGFMCRNDSLASFSPAVKIIASLFMFLGGTNFYLHFKAFKQKGKSHHLKNEEFRFMLIWLIVLIVAIIALAQVKLDNFPIEGIPNVILNVTSAVTTTGFAASDYTDWLTGVAALLFLAMVIGGSSGSTSGGIKIGRLLIIVKYVYAGIKKSLHPKGVYDVKINGNSIDRDSVASAITMVILFFITLFVGSLVMMICDLNFLDSFTVICANLTTFGPAIGTFGPYGSYASLPWFGKLILVLTMWLGRIEIVTGLVLFTPTFWKEYIWSRKRMLGSLKKNGNGKKLFRH